MVAYEKAYNILEKKIKSKWRKNWMIPGILLFHVVY